MSDPGPPVVKLRVTPSGFIASTGSELDALTKGFETLSTIQQTAAAEALGRAAGDVAGEARGRAAGEVVGHTRGSAEMAQQANRRMLAQASNTFVLSTFRADGDPLMNLMSQPQIWGRFGNELRQDDNFSAFRGGVRRPTDMANFHHDFVRHVNARGVNANNANLADYAYEVRGRPGNFITMTNMVRQVAAAMDARQLPAIAHGAPGG